MERRQGRIERLFGSGTDLREVKSVFASSQLTSEMRCVDGGLVEDELVGVIASNIHTCRFIHIAFAMAARP